MVEWKHQTMEKMLLQAANSSQFSGWNDNLSGLIETTKQSYTQHLLEDSELEFVAGGINRQEEKKE